MKRKFSSTLLALSLVLGMSATQVSALKFNDLKGYGWAEKYIEDASNKEVIKGYPNGTFNPGSPVSRVESLVMIANLYPKSDVNDIYKNSLSKYKKQLDSAKIEEWARPYIVFAIEKGIIKPAVINGLFDINSRKYIAAKRYEVCVFLVRGLGIEKDKNYSAKVAYKDSSKIDTRAVPYIDLLQRKGIISKNGDGSGNFLPENIITRAETAVMLSNAYKYSAKAKGTSTPSTTGTNPNNTVKPVAPIAPAQPTVENVNGKISLITMTDTDLTITVTTDSNQIKNYTVKKNELVVKVGDAISSYTGLKIGQQATFTLNNGKLTQIHSQLETERISGTLEAVSSDKGTITVKSKDTVKELKYDANSQMYLNDALSVVTALPKGAQIDVYYQGDKVTKANIVYTKAEYKGEITAYNQSSITVKDEKGNIKTKTLDRTAKIYRNEKRIDVTDLAIGDKATISTDSDKIINVAVEAKSVKYMSATIKSIQMNSDYNTVTIADREGVDHTLTINNSSMIRLNDKKDNIYSLKIGYEVDVYAQGGLVEEIITKGEFKQATIGGVVTDVDTVDKFVEVKQNDGKVVKLYYANTTRIEKLSDGKTIEARDIYKGDFVTGIGVMSGGNINATRIIANI